MIQVNTNIVLSFLAFNK